MKNKLSNIFMYVLSTICIIALISIVVILLIPFIQDKTTPLSEYKYSYNLDEELYYIGVDIPAGTYKFQAVDGAEGSFEIYESYNGYDSYKGSYEVRKSRNKDVLYHKHGGDRYFLKKESKIRNLTLEDNQVIRLRSNTKLVIYTNNIDNP